MSSISLEQQQRTRAYVPVDVLVVGIKRAEVRDYMVDEYKILMQIRRLANHDGFESEKRNFILNPLIDKEPVKIFENWSDVLDTLKCVMARAREFCTRWMFCLLMPKYNELQ